MRPFVLVRRPTCYQTATVPLPTPSANSQLTDLGLCTKLDEGIPPTDVINAAAEETMTAEQLGATAPPPSEGTGHERILPHVHITHDRKLAFSTVGTPDYIAAEVLLKKGYGKEADW